MTTNNDYPGEGELYWIEVRRMKRTKWDSNPEVVDEYSSNEDNLGFIKEIYEDITKNLQMEIK